MESLISTLISTVVYLVAVTILTWIFSRRNAALRKKLDDLAKKSQLEQDIELATTSQLIQELTRRVPGFIILLPAPSNKNETSIAVHIGGMNAEAAVSCMNIACQVIRSKPSED